VTTQSALRNPQASDWVNTYYGYDRAGRQTDVVDGQGYYTRNSYDAFGNLTKTIQFAKPLAAIPASLPNFSAFTPPPSTAARTTNPDPAGYDRVVQFTYDLLNRQLQQTRVGVLYSTLDATGSLAQQIGNLTSSTAYDAVGNATTATDAQGNVTTTYYNALGQVVGVRQPTRQSASAPTGVTVRSINASYALASASTLVLQWDSLQSWGSGDVRVNTTYDSDVTTYTRE